MVRGVRGAALYDFVSGRVVDLPAGVIAHLVQGTSAVALDGAPPEVGAWASGMVSRGLATLTQRAEPLPEEPVQAPSSRIRFAWLELTQRCNLRCVHCYASCTPMSDGPMALDHWLRVLGELRGLDVPAVQFVGGEPALSPGLEDLIYAAGGLGFSTIEVFTNATVLTRAHLAALTSVGGRLATTLYSAQAEVHDRVTGVRGSHAATVRTLQQARQQRIPVRVASVVTAVNEGRLGELQRLVRSLGARWDKADPVRPVGRGAAPGCRTSVHRPRVTPPFKTSRASFEQNRRGNPCWQGKLAIIDTGEVLPCVFAREVPVGSVLEQPLAEIVAAEPLQACWGLSKDHLEGCADCEYRYACHDCRPLAMGLEGGHRQARTASCCYEPSTGRWG